jgi:hypothetical protein
MIVNRQELESWDMATLKRNYSGGGKKTRVEIRRQNAAKRNKVQLIENKRFREMADSTPSMISRACSPVAKRFISRSETKPFVFIGFVPLGATKRNETGRLPMSAIARSVQRDVAMRESLDAPHFLIASPLRSLQ